MRYPTANYVMNTGKKLIVITGRDEAEEVRKRAEGYEVIVAPVDVAAFISVDMIVKLLENQDLKQISMILVPGLMGGDVSVITKKLGVRCFKGTKNSYDLGGLLKNIGKMVLSTTKPADVYLRDFAVHEYQELLKNATEYDFEVGKLPIGGNQVPRIVAEIVDAPLLDEGGVLMKSKRYLESGADIIDVGAVANSDNSKKIGGMVSALSDYIDSPISIDSMRKSEIEAAVTNGADLVLSVDEENYDLDIPSKTAIVVVPSRRESGPEGIVKSLLKNIELVKSAGFKKIVADPILRPPLKGLSDSLVAYNMFLKKQRVPTLMGLGNVTEMIDADSIGINGILGSLVMELGVSLILTTENSIKTRNCITELKGSVVMNYLAKSRNALPKDLGVDLLIAKSKNDSAPKKMANCSPCTKHFEEGLDPRGIFKISVDHDEGLIIVKHIIGKNERCFKGGGAISILGHLLSEGLVGKQSHAAYMGRELQKAEVCLRLGKAYSQDEPIFNYSNTNSIDGHI